MTVGDDMSVIQDDLADLCAALGLPGPPQPRSPHAVMRDCIDRARAIRDALVERAIDDFRRERGAS